MRLKLIPHPETPCSSLSGIDVGVVRTAQATLELHYFVSGKIREIKFPEAREAERRDKLWEHSCFELFVRGEGSKVYHEVNFSPSLSWATYRFSDYRSGMQLARASLRPEIETRVTAKTFVLIAKLSMANLPGLTEVAVWDIALSAVLEPKMGEKSYWALTHPPGKPDFHHGDCFALKLPPPGGS
jgi:hypothetical protein